MKRMISALLALLTLLAFVPAALGEDWALPEGTAVEIDLNGDGAQERVSWAMVPGEYDDYLTLTVETDEAGTLTYTTDIIYAGQVFAVDLDGDGAVELLLTGDVMSDDYCTWCLRYDGGVLYEVLFPDGSRGDDNSDGYFKAGYGMASLTGDGRLSLTGSQDVLGTWFCSRTLALTPYDRFEFDDDGLWTREAEAPFDDETWEYAALKTVRDVPYTDEDGNAGTLGPGTQLILIATDKRETARFITRDGLSGTLSIDRDWERGWGWQVAGIPEADCFEFLPYAD